MKKIMPVETAVPVIAWPRPRQFRPPFTRATRPVPAAPTAAPSVGVKMPA
jgi:hypothetical protein